jgi:hypothetical protein
LALPFCSCKIVYMIMYLYVKLITTHYTSDSAITTSALQLGLMERDTLTGDWGGARTWLKERGITLKPRLTQFYQGMTSGDDNHDFELGGKADLLLNADLGKFGFWQGLSLTVHAEYNFGESVRKYLRWLRQD